MPKIATHGIFGPKYKVFSIFVRQKAHSEFALASNSFAKVPFHNYSKVSRNKNIWKIICLKTFIEINPAFS